MPYKAQKTITIRYETYEKLQQLKQQLQLDSIDELINKLIDTYYNTQKETETTENKLKQLQNEITQLKELMTTIITKLDELTKRHVIVQLQLVPPQTTNLQVQQQTTTAQQNTAITQNETENNEIPEFLRNNPWINIIRNRHA